MQIKGKNNWTVADMPERIIFFTNRLCFCLITTMRQKKHKHNALLTFFTRKKTLAKQQPRIVYTVLKKNRDGFFSNGLLWVNRKLLPARRDKWVFLLRYYFSFCSKDRSHKNFQRGTLHWVTRVLSKRTRVFVRICITIFQTRIGFFL